MTFQTDTIQTIKIYFDIWYIWSKSLCFSFFFHSVNKEILIFETIDGSLTHMIIGKPKVQI